MRILQTSSSKTFLLAVLLLLLVGVSLFIGSFPLSIQTVGRALTSFADTAQPEAIITHIRLVRICGSILCGSCLALSGAILQQTLQNPMAGPSVLGINAASGLATLLGLLLTPSLGKLNYLYTLGGAFSATLIVLLLSSACRFSKLTLTLCGLALSSFLGAVSDTLLTLQPQLSIARIDFLVGSFAYITEEQLVALGPLMLFVILLSCLLSRPLNLLNLGDDLCRSLGVPVMLIRILLLFLSATLSSLAISLCGLVGFIGLLVPHISQLLVERNDPFSLFCTTLVGSMIALGSDTLARTLFSPYELPVGIVLSFLGSPVFFFLLATRHRRTTIA